MLCEYNDYLSIIYSATEEALLSSTAVDNVEKNYPAPFTYNILYALGLAMSIGCVFLAIRVRHLATKTKPLTIDQMR